MQKSVVLTFACVMLSLGINSCNQASDIQPESSIEKTNNPVEEANNSDNASINCEVDTTQAPEITETNKRLVLDLCKEHYPRIKQILVKDDFEPASNILIIFKKNVDIADTGSNKISLGVRWFTDNRKNPQEIGGVLVHEMVHVVQSYSPQSVPGWLVEGIADYIRYGKIYSDQQGKEPPPMNCREGQHYTTNTYGCAAAFLNYILKDKSPEVLIDLNTALRLNEYNDAFFSTNIAGGKSLDQLWQECIQPGQDCEGGRS